MSLHLTARHLASIAGRTTPLMTDLAHWMNQLCPQYEIDTPQEFCHFLAQACHETDHFVTLREYASGRGYEGRVDLGNSQPGDGVRFKGRGIFQTTGRANYTQLGIKKGRRDLFVTNPTLLEQPEYAVWSACEYWRTRRLNDIANHADTDVLKKKYRGNIIDVSPVEYISLAINGGYNGMAERKGFYAKALQVLVDETMVPKPRGLPITPHKPRQRAKPVARPAIKVATTAPSETITIYSGTISAINDHLLTVVIAKGRRQTLQTSSLRGLRPGVLIAWCEEDCNRLRIGERWTRVRSIAVVRPQIIKKNSY
jgi:putative chitinase